MKKNIFLTLLCLLIWQLNSMAQEIRQGNLEITPHKTTSLIFPYAIKSVDRGSRDILAQVPRQVDNVLHVKAAREGFRNTNLTVITSDGRLYNFSVSYAANPETTLIELEEHPDRGGSVLFTGSRLNEEQLKNIAQELAGDFRFYYGIKDKAGGAKATLEGIYTYGNTLFYRVVITNNSPVPYNLDFMRISVQDRRQRKRTAVQEVEVKPAFIYGLGKKGLASGFSKVLVIALEKTSITQNKKLVLDLFEQQGGRHLKLQVRHRHILQAPPLLPDNIL